jgi:pimeloyl-ACP methyl ester carboxylesterase
MAAPADRAAGTPLRRRPAELVGLRTADGWDLDGLLYRSAGGVQEAAADPLVVLHLHGKGANMLQVTARFLPELLPEAAHFALNMRCHDLAHNTDRADRPVAGGMYERLDDGQPDIAAAVAFLQAEGYRRIVLAGHSSGGYYAGVYRGAPGEIAGRVLLSPLTTNRTALGWWFPGAGELEDALAEAGRLVTAGRADALINLPGWYWAISARSLLERAAQSDSRWIDAVNADASPVLVLWGEAEDRDAEWRQRFDEIAAPVKQMSVVAGSDHWYRGHEDAVAELCAEFLREL